MDLGSIRNNDLMHIGNGNGRPRYTENLCNIDLQVFSFSLASKIKRNSTNVMCWCMLRNASYTIS